MMTLRTRAAMAVRNAILEYVLSDRLSRQRPTIGNIAVAAVAIEREHAILASNASTSKLDRRLVLPLHWISDPHDRIMGLTAPRSLRDQARAPTSDCERETHSDPDLSESNAG